MKTMTKLSMFLFMTAGVLFSQSYNYHHMGGWHPFGWAGGFMLLLWIILIALIVFILVKVINKGSLSGITFESPLDILKKRYARGEIVKEKFEKMKKEVR